MKFGTIQVSAPVIQDLFTVKFLELHGCYVGGVEFRRDQEEGGELDSHEEAIPEEIKSREVVG